MVGKYASAWMEVPVHTDVPANDFLPIANITMIGNGYPGKNLTSGIYTPVVSLSKGIDGSLRRKNSRASFIRGTQGAMLR